MSTTTDTTKTPDQLRAEADRHDEAAAASFERCDTDGFLSQWADGINARLLRHEAEIQENGGKATFPGLFDAQGRRIRARLMTVQSFRGYGTDQVWGVLDASGRRVQLWIPRQSSVRIVDEPDGKWHREHGVAPSPRSKMAKLGLHEEEELAPAKAEIAASGRGLAGAASAHVVSRRTDGGFPEDAVLFA